MKRRSKTALGVHICDDRISLALLRSGKDGLELLKAATLGVPEGAIKDGNIQDGERFCKALRDLRVRSRIRAGSRAAISLLARPVVLQIIDPPDQVPANVSRFVENEMKRAVALSGSEVILDFCRIAPASPSRFVSFGNEPGGASQKRGRLLAAATDGPRVTGLATVCGRAGLNVEVIEPPLIAYVRAFSAKKIAPRFDRSVLIAICTKRDLFLCVFKKGNLDFVRTRNVNEEQLGTSPLGASRLCGCLAEEINEILRFYEVEAPEDSQQWDINVVAEGVELPADADESLKTAVGHENLRVATSENAWRDTPVTGFQSRKGSPSGDIGTDKSPTLQSYGDGAISPVAIGLAMRLLDADDSNLRINLVPPESAEIKSAKKDLLVATNVIAVVLLLMILATGGLATLTKNVNRRIIGRGQSGLSQATFALLAEREQLDRQIEQLSDRPKRLEDILGSHPAVDWSKVLRDIGDRTPTTVRITELRSKNDPKLCLEGLALTHEAVRLFVEMLSKSQYIRSASLNQVERDDQADGLVRYSINCWLAVPPGTPNGVKGEK